MCAIRVFNRTSSVYNTPIERSWGDTNMVTRKWKAEFRVLEAEGYISMDSASLDHAADIFSLTTVYLPAIKRDIDAHYSMVRHMKKAKDTTNPNYPTGKQRRGQLYEDYASLKTPMTADEICAVRSVGVAYFSRAEITSRGRLTPSFALKTEKNALLLSLSRLRCRSQRNTRRIGVSPSSCDNTTSSAPSLLVRLNSDKGKGCVVKKRPRPPSGGSAGGS